MTSITQSQATICKGCWQHMSMPIPIRGPLSIPLRMLGVKISRMNPNLCNICETMFTRVKRRKQIIVTSTVLFADLRGYTALSQEAASSEVVDMLHGFTDECAQAVWARDGIVNKFIGDAMLAIFNFPIMRDDHVEQAVLAAQDIQRRWAERSGQALTGTASSLGLGIGIHTGTASIGEIGTAYKDFTIVGPMVNMASRIQGAASAGEILVSSDVYAKVRTLFAESQPRQFDLKGIELPTTLHRLVA
jgi:class 3 adenylate cyclase